MSECKGEVGWLLLGGVAVLWLCCAVDLSRAVVCVMDVVFICGPVMLGTYWRGEVRDPLVTQ